MARLTELEEDKKFPTELFQRLRVEYEDRIRQLEACEPSESAPNRRLFSNESARLQEEALRVERRTILHLRNERAINDHSLRRNQRDLHLTKARLEET